MIDPREPAFPCPFSPTDGFTGLTTREYLAAHALQGLLANPGVNLDASADEVATWAIGNADALLAALAQEAS